MDDRSRNDDLVIRQTVAHLHTLAIEHGKRLATIEYYARTAASGVMTLVVAGFLAAAFHIWKG